MEDSDIKFHLTTHAFNQPSCSWSANYDFWTVTPTEKVKSFLTINQKEPKGYKFTEVSKATTVDGIETSFQILTVPSVVNIQVVNPKLEKVKLKVEQIVSGKKPKTKWEAECFYKETWESFSIYSKLQGGEKNEGQGLHW